MLARVGCARNDVLMLDAYVQDNLYRLGLLTHLQSSEVPLKVPECLRDLRAMYEAATIDDINDAYARFALDDDHIFTCVGTSGPTPPPQQPPQAVRLPTEQSLVGAPRHSTM